MLKNRYTCLVVIYDIKLAYIGFLVLLDKTNCIGAVYGVLGFAGLPYYSAFHYITTSLYLLALLYVPVQAGQTRTPRHV